MKFITTPEATKYSTVKLFQGMLEELRSNRTEEQFNDLLEHALFIKKNQINELNCTQDQFRRLIDFYLKEQAYPNKIGNNFIN